MKKPWRTPAVKTHKRTTGREMRLKLTPAELTRSRLALASKDAPLETIKTWSKRQRDAADAWAMRQHLIASDNDHLRRLKCPPHVEGLPDLNYDGIWPDVSGRES